MTSDSEHLATVSPDGQWQWDGSEWVPLAPRPPAPPLPPPPFTETVLAPTPAATSVDNTFAWTLAFAPLISVAVTGVLATMVTSGLEVISVVVAIALNSGLAILDNRRVRASGVEISNAMAVFLVPAYLFIRQGKLQQNYAIAIIWCVSFLISLGGAGIIANTVGVQMDVDRVEQNIESEILDQTGYSVTADCPSSVAVRPGSTFQCFVKASDGSGGIVDVTVQNSAGDIVWVVRQ